MPCGEWGWRGEAVHLPPWHLPPPFCSFPPPVHLPPHCTFPPPNHLPPTLPYYPHQVVETGFPELATFSVGEGADRRTVVCFQQQLINFTLGLTGFEAASEAENVVVPAMGEGVGEVGGEASLDSDFESRAEAQGSPGTSKAGSSPELQDTASSASRRAAAPARRAVAPGRRRRPERAVYQPPSRSQPLNPTAAPFVSPPTSPTRLTASPAPLNPCASPWVSPPTSPCRSPPPASPEPRERGKKPTRGVYQAPRGRGKQVRGALAERRPGEAPPGSPSSPGEGEDATEQVVAEVTAAVGGVQIEGPAIDYLSFRTSDSTISIDQFGHVVEIYDFPGHFTSQDLQAEFQALGLK